jgi:hypothetical protein
MLLEWVPEWVRTNIAALFFMAMLFFFLVLTLYGFAPALRSWISEKRMMRRMEKEGRVFKLVYGVGECPYVTAEEDEDKERAMPKNGAGFRKKGVRRAKRKRLDTGSEQALDSPSREKLDRLMENLQIESGSLCFKHGAIYVVTCEGKRRRWKRLGRWETLRQDAGD